MIAVVLDIAVNMILDMRVEFAEPLTEYEIARDILIMGGILVAMIWLRYTDRLT